MWDLKVLMESSLHPGDHWTQHQLRISLELMHISRVHLPLCAVEALME